MSLSRKRGILLLIPLVVALSLVLSVFNITTPIAQTTPQIMVYKVTGSGDECGDSVVVKLFIFV